MIASLTTLTKAALLGIIEGICEFLPISSTGHLILLRHFLGFSEVDFGAGFVIMIQLGSILALVALYARYFFSIALTLPTSAVSRRFVIAILAAFLPAALTGVIFGHFITTALFNPLVVCASLIIGGIVLLWADKRSFVPIYTEARDFPLSLAVKIGLFQCVAMIPGVSRSGATILGGLLWGADKRSATEFSFFLAVPTMIGAFAYELYKQRDSLSASGIELIATGFVTAFLSGFIVVRYMIPFVVRFGFAPFAWWRIAVGAIGLAALLAT